MKDFLARLYSIYTGIFFVLTGIIFLLPQLLLAQKEKWHVLTLKMNHYWAWTLIRIIMMPVEITWEEKIDKKQRYVLCSNHFSFLDIPTNYLLGIPFKYIGKASIAKVPIFGYMFKKIHIMVDRASIRSRGTSMQQTKEAISKGFNMCFFPEGGIHSENPPQMVHFRDGAFKLACEFDTPILPIALPNNYRIFPDNGRFLLYRNPLKITVCKPIYPTGKTDDDIKSLKQKTYDVIQHQLNIQSIKGND